MSVSRGQGQENGGLETGELAEVVDSLLEVIAAQVLERAGADVLHAERRGRGATDDGLAEVGVAVLREVAQEAAGKRVPGAGRVRDSLERVGRRAENVFFEEEKCAVLAPLHNHRFRAEGTQGLCDRERCA